LLADEPIAAADLAAGRQRAAEFRNPLDLTAELDLFDKQRVANLKGC
jgi:hypothetical protein